MSFCLSNNIKNVRMIKKGGLLQYYLISVLFAKSHFRVCNGILCGWHVAFCFHFHYFQSRLNRAGARYGKNKSISLSCLPVIKFLSRASFVFHLQKQKHVSRLN